MCLCGALGSIPFNLICNMTTFRKNDLTPTQGLKVCVRNRICACVVLYAQFPCNWTCNITTFRKKTCLDLLTPPPGVEGVYTVCVFAAAKLLPNKLIFIFKFLAYLSFTQFRIRG